MKRWMPVPIQRPAAPAGAAIRTRKSGLAHDDGIPEIWPAKRAFPCTFSETALVSSTACAAVPALQTSVPVTALTGPGVPLELLPLSTRPSTSKKVVPSSRLTRACPLCTDHGPAPARMPATGLSTAGAVITPTMLFQRTTSHQGRRQNPSPYTTQGEVIQPILSSYSLFLCFHLSA